DVVPDYLKSGVYTPRPSLRTLSNAMDVGHPGNFERMEHLFEGDWRAMKAMVSGGVVNDERTLWSMHQLHAQYGVFVDPHTAVGCAVAQDFIEAGRRGGEQVVILATAHPGKFAATVKKATGHEPELPGRLAECLTLPKQAVAMGPEPAELSGYLLDNFS
ncbi:MAG TPA: threonine synthase, partial [bacterium]|nr:threonine synthase [bacterium]